MADQSAQRSQNQSQIAERAAKDPAFRQELVADPRGVLARELGVAMPDFLEVRVLEEPFGRQQADDPTRFVQSARAAQEVHEHLRLVVGMADGEQPPRPGGAIA